MQFIIQSLSGIIPGGKHGGGNGHISELICVCQVVNVCV